MLIINIISVFIMHLSCGKICREATIRKLGLSLIAILPLILLVACGSSGGVSTNQLPAKILTSIKVSPGVQSVPIGVFIQYKATGTYSDGETQDVTNKVRWSVSDAATHVSINQNGLAVGTFTDSAFVNASLDGIESSAQLIITAATVKSIVVTPESHALAVGATAQYTATAENSDGSSTNLTPPNIVWASSNPRAATISLNGLVTAVSPHELTVISATFAGSIVGSTTLTTTSVMPVSMAVTFAGGATMPIGLTQSAIATVTFSDGSVQRMPANQVQWSSTNPLVASINNGIVSSVESGGTSIIASYLNISGRTALSVRKGTLAGITANSLSLNGIIPISVGATNKLIATGTYNADDGGASFNFILESANWSSTNPSLMTVSNNGIATAVAVGSGVSIRAEVGAVISPIGSTAPNNNTFNIVSNLVLTSLQIIPGNNISLNSAFGLNQQYTALGIYSDGSTVDLTNVATWTSSNTGLATVTSFGLYSGGLATVNTNTSSGGSTTITASYSGGGIPILQSVGLTVNPVRVVSITISANPESGNVVVPNGGTLPGYVGLAYPLKAIANFSDGSNRDITNLANWAVTGTGTAVRVGNAVSIPATDSNPGIIGNKGILYVLIPSGTATNITAAFGGVTSPAYIVSSSIASITGVSLTVLPATSMPTLNVLPGTAGLQQQYKAIATLSSPIGSASVGAYDVTNCTTGTGSSTGWSSTTIGAATVGNTSSPNTSSPGSNSGNAGLVTVALGSTVGNSTIIKQKLVTIESSVTLTIGAATLSSIQITPSLISPATMFFMPNNTFATKLFYASGIYTGGTGAGTYDLTQLNGWSSSNTGVATIANGSSNPSTSPPSGGGVVRSIGAGTTSIKFSIGSVTSESISVQVTN